MLEMPELWVSKLVPDFPNGDRISLHHLLTHSSGISNINDFPDYDRFSRFPHTPAQLVALFGDKPLEFEPGTDYSYSNSNYNLLAYIIERVSGMPYGEFLRKSIFEPLGMNSTGHHGDARALIPNQASGYAPAGVSGLENAPYLDWSVKTGNGSLYSTVDDLYKFDRAFYGDRLLNPGSLAKMFVESGNKNSYGWFVRQRFGRRVVASNGRSPGFTSSLERFMDDNVCIIVLSNLYISTPIAADLAAIVFEEPYTNPADIRPVLLPLQAAAVLLGRYRFGDDFSRPGVIVTIRRQEGDMLLDWGGGFTSPLVPLSETTFIDRNFWATVSFARDPDGKITQLRWNYGKDYVAERIVED